ncbi:MAG: cytochrome B561 [Candidatus Gallionella acididurans]|uniref:Cytochrome B561 n=1 Tax=Candidatus Gallionella acididurans TaxID=1796491 RepID=A0A139BRV7_9PROT|nr:MAG: cytochrome B561 [Candidatus Gallionella acididurans]
MNYGSINNNGFKTVNQNHKIIHPLWLRLGHWINLVALVIMVLSGWRIYNASPIFAFRFPDMATLGGWLGGALLWHFAAMWLVLCNGLMYLLLNIATGRFRKQFFPLRLRELLRDFAAALKGRLTHDTLTEYNAVQKLAYLFVIADIILLVLSGLVVWKPVQFPLLRELMGDYDNARMIHFLAMAALLAFVAIHVAMVALVPRTLIMMIRGR